MSIRNEFNFPENGALLVVETQVSLARDPTAVDLQPIVGNSRRRSSMAYTVSRQPFEYRKDPDHVR